MEFKEERKLRAALGAFLGSLVGALVYFLLSRVGYISALSGLLAILCALWGYKKLGGAPAERSGVLLCVIFTLLSVVLGWYCNLAYDIMEVFEDVDYLSCLRAAYRILSLPDVASAYFGNLALSLLFAVLGLFGALRGKNR